MRTIPMARRLILGDTDPEVEQERIAMIDHARIVSHWILDAGWFYFILHPLDHCVIHDITGRPFVQIGTDNLVIWYRPAVQLTRCNTINMWGASTPTGSWYSQDLPDKAIPDLVSLLKTLI